MRHAPSVLIIEKARFPAHMLVEECERPGKTADNRDAIIRFQRRTDIGLFEKIGRFFSDLAHGVTRASGFCCDKQELPPTLHIRGALCTIKRDGGICKAQPASQPGGLARERAAFSVLTVEVREASADMRVPDAALAARVAGELRDRFAANGKAADLSAVECFLAMDAHPDAGLTPQHIVQLMQFSDAMARLSGPLKQELGTDVLRHVLDRLQHWQDDIARITAPGPGGPRPAYPGFAFRALAAFHSPAASPSVAAAAPAPEQREPAATREQPAEPPATPGKAPPAPAPMPAAPPPPPPPPQGAPPTIRRAGGLSAAPDTTELTAARTRLKRAPANDRTRANPALEDDQTFASLMAKVLAQRRANMNEDAERSKDERDEGDWG